MKAISSSLLLIASLALFYFLLRYPTSHFIFPFHDDAEALYHTMAVLKGQVLYIDDHSHHFLGYILHFLLGTILFGFSPELTHQIALLNQTLTAYGVFLVASFFVSKRWSVLAAVLCLTAREPWIQGFFIQHQLNLLYTFALYLFLVHNQSGRIAALAGASGLLGLMFVYDQRAVVFLFALVAATYSVKRSKLALASYLAPLAAAAIYLTVNDAWYDFVQQTYIFPKAYRVGSFSLLEFLWLGAVAHKYLVTLTPILLGAGLVGIIHVLRLPKLETGQKILAWFGLPLLLMPLFGARDYHYYTITWLPYLSVFAVISLAAVNHFRSATVKLYKAVLVLPILLALGQASNIARDPFLKDKSDDGATQVVDFLRANMADRDSLYVWNYRLDLYVRLGKLSPYPFVNQIMIHPDHGVKDPEKRKLHVHPEYEVQFLELLRHSPPTYVAIFNESEELPSRAFSSLQDTLATRYKLALAVSSQDVSKRPTNFRVYQLVG